MREMKEMSTSASTELYPREGDDANGRYLLAKSPSAAEKYWYLAIWLYDMHDLSMIKLVKFLHQLRIVLVRCMSPGN